MKDGAAWLFSSIDVWGRGGFFRFYRKLKQKKEKNDSWLMSTLLYEIFDRNFDEGIRNNPRVAKSWRSIDAEIE